MGQFREVFKAVRATQEPQRDLQVKEEESCAKYQLETLSLTYLRKGNVGEPVT